MEYWEDRISKAVVISAFFQYSDTPILQAPILRHSVMLSKISLEGVICAFVHAVQNTAQR